MRKMHKWAKHEMSDERVHARKLWREGWPDRHGLSEEKVRDRLRNQWGWRFVGEYDAVYAREKAKAKRKKRLAKEQEQMEQRKARQEAEAEAEAKWLAEDAKKPPHKRG